MRAFVLVFVSVMTTAYPLTAEPLDKSACEALKAEHTTLLDSGLKGDIARGHQWAKEYAGQLKLIQIRRVFEIEEQLAFRCKRASLTTAVVIPSLRVPPPAKVEQTNANVKAVPAGRLRGAPGRLRGAPGRLRGVRRSAVPIPVKRPALNGGATERQATGARAAKPVAKAKVGPPLDAKAKLPKVIRLRQPKKAASEKARQINAREAKARQTRARRARQKRRRPDTYVPPPANPGYQPSLSSP